MRLGVDVGDDRDARRRYADATEHLRPRRVGGASDRASRGNALGRECVCVAVGCECVCVQCGAATDATSFRAEESTAAASSALRGAHGSALLRESGPSRE